MSTYLGGEKMLHIVPHFALTLLTGHSGPQGVLDVVAGLTPVVFARLPTGHPRGCIVSISGGAGLVCQRQDQECPKRYLERHEAPLGPGEAFAGFQVAALRSKSADSRVIIA
eukprot:scaffold7340_cov266-Pinguiococcus_pyrenoidosus.AAC.8